MKIFISIILLLTGVEANAGTVYWAWVYLPTPAELKQYIVNSKTMLVSETVGQIVFKDPKDLPLDDPSYPPGWHRVPNLDLDI